VVVLYTAALTGLRATLSASGDMAPPPPATAASATDTQSRLLWSSLLHSVVRMLKGSGGMGVGGVGHDATGWVAVQVPRWLATLAAEDRVQDPSVEVNAQV
jgi:hypothetical protein